MTEQLDVPDDRPNLPDVVRRTTQALEVPVAEFEGEFIRTMNGKLPALSLEMPVGYKRGTHLKLELEVRVRDVSVTADKNDELTRVHVFSLEEVKLLGAYTADELDPGVGGNAAVGAEDEEGEHSDIGF